MKEVQETMQNTMVSIQMADSLIVLKCPGRLHSVCVIENSYSERGLRPWENQAPASCSLWTSWNQSHSHGAELEVGGLRGGQANLVSLKSVSQRKLDTSSYQRNSLCVGCCDIRWVVERWPDSIFQKAWWRMTMAKAVFHRGAVSLSIAFIFVPSPVSLKNFYLNSLNSA